MVPTIEYPQGDHKADMPDINASSEQVNISNILVDIMVIMLPTIIPTTHQQKIKTVAGNVECGASL
jgi:hypothetical protein